MVSTHTHIYIYICTYIYIDTIYKYTRQSFGIIVQGIPRVEIDTSLTSPTDCSHHIQTLQSAAQSATQSGPVTFAQGSASHAGVIPG